MEFQYFILLILCGFILILFILGLNRILRIFIWNSLATFCVLIFYLFLEILLNLIDKNPWNVIKNPDLLAWIIMNNKVIFAIIAYFLFLVLFYKNSLIQININWILKKIVGYTFFPILTVAVLAFSSLIVINWPEILSYSNYLNQITSLGIESKPVLDILQLLPAILIVLVFISFALFVEINIKISFPSLLRKNQESQEKSD